MSTLKSKYYQEYGKRVRKKRVINETYQEKLDRLKEEMKNENIVNEKIEKLGEALAEKIYERK